MALVGDLELASFDYTDPSLKGERFHEAMGEARAAGWLASGPHGLIVLDREAGEFFFHILALTAESLHPECRLLFPGKSDAFFQEGINAQRSVQPGP